MGETPGLFERIANDWLRELFDGEPPPLEPPPEPDLETRRTPQDLAHLDRKSTNMDETPDLFERFHNDRLREIFGPDLETRRTPQDLAHYDAPVKQALDDAHAGETRVAYKRAWRHWREWCGEHDETPFPANPDAIRKYLRWRHAHIWDRSTQQWRERRTGEYGDSAARIAAAAIGYSHERAGWHNPCHSWQVRYELRCLARRTGQRASAEGRMRVRQAAPLTPTELHLIRATACLPRKGKRTESEEHAVRRGQVDIALCGVLATAGLRRSEAAALRWRHVKFEPKGHALLRIERSKTDQFGAGAIVGVPERVAADLLAIRGDAGENDSVFGMCSHTINRRIRAACKHAGLDWERFSGHSGRVGMAIMMGRNSAPLTIIARQGRWKSLKQALQYARNESLEEVLRYL